MKHIAPHSPPLFRAPLLRPRSHAHIHLLRIRLRRRSQRLIGNFSLNLLFLASLSEFIDASRVNFVRVALVQIDEEDDVVAEGGQAVEGGHFNRECEEIVDEGVEDFVGHGSGGHVGDALVVM